MRFKNIKVPLIVAISTIGLMGGVISHAKRFYVTPLNTASFSFDTIDLVNGTMKEATVDFGMASKMPFVHIYHSGDKRKKFSMGNFSNSFDTHINPKLRYKQEKLASRLKVSAKNACEKGWQDIAPEAYLGKLEGLKAVYEKETGLCQVYDDYHNLKTTLLIKDKRYKSLASETMKLLKRADGTEVLFYQDAKHAWHNTTNSPMKLTETDSGYDVLLEDGKIESYDEEGRLVQIKDDAVIYTLTYNRYGKLVSVNDNFEHVMTLKYKKGKGLLKSVTYFDGTTVKYRYKHGKLKKVIYPDGRIQKYSYEHKNLVAVYKDGVLQKSYDYDNGKVDKVAGIKGTNPIFISYDRDSISVEEKGMNTEYTFIVTHSQAKQETVEDDEGMLVKAYDDNGHIISTTDKLGLTHVTLHDKDGLVKQDIDAIGTNREQTVKTQYDTRTNKPVVIDKGNTVEYKVYDSDGKLNYNVKTLVDDNGAVVQNKIEQQEYDANGLVKKIDMNGDSEEISYDEKGNAVSTKNSLGLTTEIAKYNNADLPTKIIDSDGEVTTTQYDITGKMTQETKDGVTSTMQYDKQGRLVKRTDADGVMSYFKYDDFGNTVESGNNMGEKSLYMFDEDNNLIRTEQYYKGKLTQKHQKEYDKKHRVTAEIDAYGNRTQYVYNDKGQKTQTIYADGSTESYEYDTLGSLIKQTDALGGETLYSYDADGHRTKIVTPNGATFSYEYDGFGRLVRESNPDKGETTYTYDASDRMLTSKRTTATNANGYTKTNVYDKLHRLSEVQYDNPSLNVYYTYNKKSQLISTQYKNGQTTFVYDKDNLVTKTQQINALTFVTKHSYTKTEKITQTIYPSGLQVDFKYNASGSMKNINVNGEILIDEMTIRNGALHSYRYADGTYHAREYDLNGHVTALNYPHYSEHIAYDAKDYIKQLHIDQTEKIFAYDFTGRLIDYEHNATDNQHFGYDANGNRLSLLENNSVQKNYNYLNDTNILADMTEYNNGILLNSTTYSYDEMGNIIDDGIHTYSYDARNRLEGVDDNVHYAYNGSNERVSKTVDGVTTYFIYDGHKLIGEYDGDGKVLREYIYLEDTPIAMVSEGKTYYIYADHLDTPRRITDEKHAILWRWESSPYGENTPTGSLTFNLRFPGQYYDAETGHHYNINRDYDPVTGRYTQSDPVGFKGGVNTYGYAEANPVMKKDEMGLWASKYAWKVHQKVNRIVFGSSWLTQMLDSATVAVDRRQKGYDSRLHAMRWTKHSLATAISLSNSHVRACFVLANRYKNRGDLRRAYDYLGWGLHTLQDSTSPAHKYFKPWSGNESYWTMYKHFRKEKNVPSRNHGLFRVTYWTWSMYIHNRVPNGNVFVF